LAYSESIHYLFSVSVSINDINVLWDIFRMISPSSIPIVIHAKIAPLIEVKPIQCFAVKNIYGIALTA